MGEYHHPLYFMGEYHHPLYSMLGRTTPPPLPLFYAVVLLLLFL